MVEPVNFKQFLIHIICIPPRPCLSSRPRISEEHNNHLGNLQLTGLHLPGASIFTKVGNRCISSLLHLNSLFIILFGIKSKFFATMQNSIRLINLISDYCKLIYISRIKIKHIVMAGNYKFCIDRLR